MEMLKEKWIDDGASFLRNPGSDQEQKIKGIPHFLRQEAWPSFEYIFWFGSKG